MNILAIDTSTKDLLLALKKGGEVFLSKSSQSLQHSKILFSDLETLLEKAGVCKEEIGCISVNLGPGSFTGIRIGAIFAKGMAYALKTKLACCDTFTAVALECEDALPCGIICEERNGGGYFAVAKKVDGTVKISKRGVYSAGQISEIMSEENLERIVSNSENQYCTKPILGVHGLIKNAEYAIKIGEFARENQIEPLYIKKSQAQEQLEAKQKQCESNGK